MENIEEVVSEKLEDIYYFVEDNFSGSTRYTNDLILQIKDKIRDINNLIIELNRY